MPEKTLLIFSLVLMAAFSCQWIAWRLKLPAIIFLLFTGIAAGPVFKWINPDQQLGQLLFPFISLSVAIILFEGSLTLKFSEIPGLARVIRNLITVGALITWVLITLATHLLIHFSWELSFLFAALMVVTGPTVITPMLRAIQPNANIANTLQWEGILIDPIGAILSVLVFDFIISSSISDGFISSTLGFGKIVLIAVVLGLTGGFTFGFILKKFWLPQYLHNFAILGWVCCIFAVSNYMERDSGLLAVTVMGIFLANMKNIELEDILNFKESISLLLVSFLFIILAARINFPSFIAMGWPALVLFALIQFLIRPVSVYVCALGSKLTLAERHLIAWIAPRGIMAAAISALFAIQLGSLGYSDASQLVPLTFFMIIGTVLLQSLTAKKIAIKLQVAEPEPKGFLIIGANQVAQAIAEQLITNNFPVCLADEDWSSITAAKMKGLDTYWGNPVSKHAENNLNLMGINHLLIMTPHLELNILAAKHYRLEFAAKNIYTIQTTPVQDGKIADRSNFKHGGREIFNQKSTYEHLERMISSGAKIKTTLLTEQFSYSQYMEENKEVCLPMFAIDPQECIHVFTLKPDFSPNVGWRIIGISCQKE